MTTHPQAPAIYTETTLREYVSDCISTLSFPLCPSVLNQTVMELEHWMTLLRSQEGDRFLTH